MEDLKNAIQTVYSQSSVGPEEKEKAFNYLNVFSNSENGWKFCLLLSFSQEPIQLRYFCLHVLTSKATNLQLQDLLNVKDKMISYFNSSLHDSNDDLSLIKKMAHLYVKLVIQLYPEKWPTPFQELLDMINNFKILPNENNFSLVHVDMLTSVLEVINCDVIEYALQNNSEIDRNNAKNLKESMASKDITDISSCLVKIIKTYNSINTQVLDRCLSTVVDILSWANWHIFSSMEFIALLINIINMRKSVSINALRIISALSERGMNPSQKVEFMFQKLNIINIMKQLFANIINDGIVVNTYSSIEIQFLTARNKALSIVIHQIFEIYVAYRNNEVTTANENIFALIKESISSLSHILTICFKIYPLISILPLVLAACDIISYIKHSNLENDKAFNNILIDIFTCTLKHASYPNWYNTERGLDESEFDDYRNSLISIIRNLFILTPNTAIAELSRNIGYICSFRHRILPSQTEIIITCILIAIGVININELINGISPLFQTNPCRCCNQISFILNELSQDVLVSDTIHEFIGKISKCDNTMFIKPSLQYLTSNMSNPIHSFTLLKFVKNSIDSFNESIDEGLTSTLIDSIKPYIGIQFIKINTEITNITDSNLANHYNEVYYEILSIIISNNPSIKKNNYFYETLDYLYNIINQINQSQKDSASLSFWLFRILSAFSSLIKSFTFTREFNLDIKTIIKFSLMVTQLIDRYSTYIYIRNISLSICRKLVLLGRTDYSLDAFNSIVKIIKSFYGKFDIENGEDLEYCTFAVYMLKVFPPNYFNEYLSFIFYEHLKFTTPSMELININRSSDLWKRYHDRVFQFFNLIYTITNSFDDFFSDYNLEEFDTQLDNLKECARDKLSKGSCNMTRLFTFLLICCNSEWSSYLSPKLSLLGLQIMYNFVVKSKRLKLPMRAILHTCVSWIIDVKSGNQKLVIEACKIIYKIAPSIDSCNGMGNDLVKVLGGISTMDINEFTRKMVKMNQR